jgi:hypothetical protein
VRKDFDAVNNVLAETSVGVLGELDRLSHWTSAVRRSAAASVQLLVARFRAQA